MGWNHPKGSLPPECACPPPTPTPLACPFTCSTASATLATSSAGMPALTPPRLAGRSGTARGWGRREGRASCWGSGTEGRQPAQSLLRILRYNRPPQGVVGDGRWHQEGTLLTHDLSTLLVQPVAVFNAAHTCSHPSVGACHGKKQGQEVLSSSACANAFVLYVAPGNNPTIADLDKQHQRAARRYPLPALTALKSALDSGGLVCVGTPGWKWGMISW
jgi:hypothetical protein